MDGQNSQRQAYRITTILCTVAIAIGYFGPWMTSAIRGLISGGFERDRRIAIALGVFAGIVTLIRWWRPARYRWLDWAVIGILGLECIHVANVWLDARQIRNDSRGFFEIGWGLHLTAFASIAGFAIVTLTLLLPSARWTEPSETEENEEFFDISDNTLINAMESDAR